MEAYYTGDMKIPVITYTHTAPVETNSTDDKKLDKEINNNMDKTDFWKSNHAEKMKITQPNHCSKSLSQRIKDLGCCIRWIHEELVSLINIIFH